MIIRGCYTFPPGSVMVQEKYLVNVDGAEVLGCLLKLQVI